MNLLSVIDAVPELLHNDLLLFHAVSSRDIRQLSCESAIAFPPCITRFSKALNPHRELMPNRRVAERNHRKLDREQEQNATDGCPVNASQRQKVEDDKQDRDRVEQREEGRERMRKCEGPARQGGPQERDGPQDHKSLVRGSISACQKTPTDQHREAGQLQNIAGKQRIQSHGEDCMAPYYGDEGRKSDKNHENRKNDPENAKQHVPSDSIGRDKSYLRNEQENPARKDCSVEMDELTRQVGVKNARQKVAPGESDEDSQENKHGHRGKKEIVRVFANGK